MLYRILYSITLLLFISVNYTYSDPFSPTVLKLTVPAEISYSFDGSPLVIPVSVSGTPVALYLVINTRGQKDNIISVKNGFLGWHYVNKIDTTIYISPRFEREVGETTITWDGIDENGNPAVSSDYDYFFWGYDNKSNRKLSCNFVKPGDWFWQHSQMLEKGEDGLPLAQPLLAGNIPLIQSSAIYHLSGKTRPYEQYGVHFKWAIGNDPLDETLIQTTLCSMYNENYDYGNAIIEPFYYYMNPVFDPHDYSVFYHNCRNGTARVSTMLKWKFVTGGEAILYDDWLGWDNLMFNEQGSGYGPVYDCGLGCYTDGNYIFLPSTTQGNYSYNMLRCLSFDGNVVFEKNMQSWYFNKTNEAHRNGSFINLYTRGNNRWFLSGPHSCLLQMIDTSRLLVDPDDETDLIIFENRNGDYFLDVAYQDDLTNGWFCNDWMEPGRQWYTGAVRVGIAIDTNNFNVVFTSYYGYGEISGLTSFAVMTQDGTGIDNMAYGDDTPFKSRYGGDKGSGLIIDTGSNYDGLYINGRRTDDQNFTFYKDWRTFYITFDSCHGVITNNQTIVEDDNPLQFEVEQNSPNPFNPSTMIRFTLPENNRVTVDIYNIAGQKIQTLVNDMMKAGTHSVTWDAGKYPSGVYVYKVKSGKFEKTMKMTLVK